MSCYPPYILLSSRRFSLKGWQKIAVGKPSAVIGSSHTREPTQKGLQTTRNNKSPVSSSIAHRHTPHATRHPPTAIHTNTRREDVILIARLWP